MPTAPIIKSSGVTPTERLLADLCERSFLRLWSYPNPYKDDGKELCDLLAVFEDHVFIFSTAKADIWIPRAQIKSWPGNAGSGQP